MFMSLKTRFDNKPWTEWGEYREYDAAKEKDYIAAHREEFEFWQFTQYLFLKQWNSLKAYAHINGVEIMGDMPIYVAADSVEMWKYRKELFLLDGEGNCAFVAGVPPDAFSDEGQLWGNPVYNWNEMKKSGYRWWKDVSITRWNCSTLSESTIFAASTGFTPSRGERECKAGKVAACSDCP